MRHQSRSSSNSCGDSMAWRSLRRPLPCSTRIIKRLESTSRTFSATTSMARRPAPYATLSATLCLGPGGAWVRARLQQPQHLFGREHAWQLAWLVDEHEMSRRGKLTQLNDSVVLVTVREHGADFGADSCFPSHWRTAA